jgi:hypothetical protein
MKGIIYILPAMKEQDAIRDVLIRRLGKKAKDSDPQLFLQSEKLQTI